MGRIAPIVRVSQALKSLGPRTRRSFAYKAPMVNPEARTLREVMRFPGMLQLRRTPQGPGAWPFRQEMERFTPTGPRDIVGIAMRPLVRRVQQDVDLTRSILSRRTKYPPGWRGRPVPSSHRGIEL